VGGKESEGGVTLGVRHFLSVTMRLESLKEYAREVGSSCRVRMEILATATFSEIVDIGLNRTFRIVEPCEDTRTERSSLVKRQVCRVPNWIIVHVNQLNSIFFRVLQSPSLS
jgi:hypothetical protein